MGRINQLPASATLNSTDVIAVDAGTGGTTNKMTATNLAGQLKTLGNYQDKLTFDSTPTAGSTNPVTSGGVKTALDGKQNTLTFDTTPTAGSTNPVTSGGIATAITQSTATKANRHVYTTSGAFNSASVLSYVNNVLETIRTGIASYSNGVLDISSGTGPRYGVVFYKLNATYWSAMLMTYATTDATLYYAKYENGTCVVITIN